MTVDEELHTADRALVQAVSAADAKAAAAVLDDDFIWVDRNGRLMTKRDVAKDLPRPPLNEAGLMAVIYRYGDVAHATTGRDQIYLLRIWVRRAQGWRLLTYHEVSQAVPATPHGPGRKDWHNPCRTLPYVAQNHDERDCLAAWQRLETAVMTHDAEEWARHVADEFLVVGAARRHTKADRKAVIEEQKATDANSAPSPLVSARLFGFSEAMVMTCEHQPFHGKAARVSRVFVKRDGKWLMAVSFQTTQQDAPVKTI